MASVGNHKPTNADNLEPASVDNMKSESVDPPKPANVDQPKPSTVGNPNPGSCSFFVARKHRFCKLIVGAGKKFCGEHLNAGDMPKGECSSKVSQYVKSERVRIPCPFDPKHTLWADQLKHHARKCNSRPKELPIYHIKGVNRISGDETDNQTQVPLSSMSKEALHSLINSVQAVYKAHSTDIPTQVLNHSILEDELSKPKNGVTARKHLCQVASLLGQLQHINVLRSRTCYIEFGAGRGQMSHWVQQAVQDQSEVSFILVDRAHVRHKMDTKHRLATDGPKYERIKIDIEHLSLGKVPSISESDIPIVAYSKHLCGAATDLTLHCLTETVPPSKHEKCADDETADNERPRRISGIVIALCCHHQCSWSSYVGRDWWVAQGLTIKDFMAVTHMSSWATCGSNKKAGKAVAEEKSGVVEKALSEVQGDFRGTSDRDNSQDVPENDGINHQTQANMAANKSGEETDISTLMEESGEETRNLKVSKIRRSSDVHTGDAISAQRLVGLDISQREDIGRQCKRLIDIGRLMYLKGHGFKGHLMYYIDRELSLENVAMVIVPQ